MRHIAAMTAFAALSVTPALAACEDLLPQATEGRASARPVAARDLALLRDIGQPGDRLDLESPLGLSSDGRRAAFVLRRADPEANSYCQGLVVLDLVTGTPRLLDRGGDLIRDRYPLFGHALPESGVPRVIVPRWSPDGRRVAYLKREGGKSQIWLARADGGGANGLSRAEAGVETFAWTADGRRLVFSSRTGETAAEAAFATEALGGYLVDARFRQLSARHPFAREATIATGYFTIDVATGAARPATEVEQALLARISVVPKDAPAAAAGSDGRVAWTVRRTGGTLDRQLVARVDGQDRVCGACMGEIVSLWWSNAGSLFFLRREGDARQSLALYRWSPAKLSEPRRLMSTEDLIIGCRPVGSEDALCLREGSQMPRRIVRIDGETGRSVTVWNPNPGFDRLERARVERLFWTNANGIETFGDLVLPPDGSSAPYPLVIVQYGSRGFLRGGTGDEYPIRALAARGHAVLSFQRPLHLSLLPGEHAGKPAEENEIHAERRSVQSALERGIALVLSKGGIDSHRVAITGLSDGSETAQWSLIHGGPFAAAAISSCCVDSSLVPLLGEAQIDAFARAGFPRPGGTGSDFWQPLSLAANASGITTPILMNLADDEYLGALNGYSTLRAAGRPVEMHVFPGEHHIKFQPAHRLAIYERNLQWFDFWLKDREDPALSLRPQYARWRALRALRSKDRPG